MFFLDYDGTLTPKKRLPQEATPAKEVLELLKTISNDVKNNIYIVSGRDRKFLEEYFVGLRVGFAAEHGNFVRKVPKPNGNSISKLRILTIQRGKQVYLGRANSKY
jgi:trehalose-phosphatase